MVWKSSVTLWYNGSTRFWVLFGSGTALFSLCNSFQTAGSAKPALVQFWTSAAGVLQGKLLLLGLLKNSRSLFCNTNFTPYTNSFHFLSSSFSCKTVIFTIVSLSRDGNGFGLLKNHLVPVKNVLDTLVPAGYTITGTYTCLYIKVFKHCLLALLL
jgi:hypothetical protein